MSALCGKGGRAPAEASDALEQAGHGEMPVNSKRLRIRGGSKEGELQKLSVTTRQSIWETAKTSVCYQRACFQRCYLKPHSITDGFV